MKTILVVEDEPMLREALCFDLKMRGYQPVEAQHGREALDCIAAHTVDLVVSDIRMPEMGGLELLNRIREADPFLPLVIFLTGYADLTPEEAYALGADAVFSKPFDRAALMAAIERIMVPPRLRWARPIEKTDVFLEGTIRMDQLGRGGFFLPDAGTRTPEALRLQTLQPLKSRVGFKVSLTEDSSTPLNLTGVGEVLWTREKDGLPGGRGIEIQALEAHCLPAVATLIEARKPRAFIPRS